MARRYTAIHFLNQFFAGVGGEEHAEVGPAWLAGPKGPGLLFERIAEDIRIGATLYVGDNYAAQGGADAIDELLALIEQHVKSGDVPPPDLLLAGPAFQAGRYGITCGALCRAAAERLGVTAVTGMHPANPGVEPYRRHVPIAETADSVLGMEEAVQRMARLALKLLRGETIDPRTDHVIPQGRRQNRFADATGAQRAIDMLLRKLAGEPFRTEYRMPTFERLVPAPAVPDAGRATIALVTSGGIVPRGNPDHIESASASRFGEYELEGLDTLRPDTHQTVHGGYDPTFANADPNRVLPLDVARDLEREGRIGKLYGRYYATVGNATSVERAREFGREIARKLIAAGVQAVILTST